MSLQSVFFGCPTTVEYLKQIAASWEIFLRPVARQIKLIKEAKPGCTWKSQADAVNTSIFIERASNHYDKRTVYILDGFNIRVPCNAIRRNGCGGFKGHESSMSKRFGQNGSVYEIVAILAIRRMVGLTQQFSVIKTVGCVEEPALPLPVNAIVLKSLSDFA